MTSKSKEMAALRNVSQTLSKVSKRIASSGAQGPSAKSTTGRRRSRRATRARKGRGAESKTITRSFQNSVSIPKAVSGQQYKTYFRQVGTPVHKEWGNGVRYEGCSVLGVISQYNGYDTICTFAVNQRAASVGGFTYFDLYSSVQPTNINRLIAIHPYFVTRLQRETLNWSKFCFRSVEVHSSAVSSTDNSDGYVAALGRDANWPLAEYSTGIDTTDILTLDKHVAGAFWEDFSLKADDYTGDRTWSTSFPSVFVDSLSSDSPNASFIEPYASTTYPYFFVISPSDGTYQSVSQAHGFIYISYIVDFYEAKTTTGSPAIASINWFNGPSYRKSHSKPDPDSLEVRHRLKMKPKEEKEKELKMKDEVTTEHSSRMEFLKNEIEKTASLLADLRKALEEVSPKGSV